MKILVTGGSGFVGAHLIPALVGQGHEVAALTRSPSSDDAVRHLGATPVRGDLDGAGALVLPPVDAVVHAAAYFRFAGPRAPYFRTNVDGTAKLLDAARAAGAGRFVHVSAAAVVMDDRGSPVRDADEAAPSFPQSFSAYIASKAQGERLVLAADRPGFRTIALRPPAIWGPGDAFGREIPHAIGSGRFAFIDRGDYPCVTCHVGNLVEAIGLAVGADVGGRAYFVNDRDIVSFRAFIGGLAARHGLSIERVRSVPYGMAFFLARLLELGAMLTRAKKDPPLTRTMVRLIGRAFVTDDSAARRELGYVGKITRAEGLASYSV